MRAAPPADYPLARSGVWAGAGCALAAVAAATPILWLGWQLRAARMIDGSANLALAALAASAALGAAWLGGRFARRGGARRLRWDGAQWQLLDASGQALDLGRLAVQVDLGPALLVRAWPGAGSVTGQASSVWLPLERRDAPAAWHGLRVALAQRVSADRRRGATHEAAQ